MPFIEKKRNFCTEEHKELAADVGRQGMVLIKKIIAHSH
jgi:hypothetical protein